VESWAMGEILTQQCRVGENGRTELFGRKALLLKKIMTLFNEIAPANLVPAAAAIRRELALYSQTRRKGFFS